MGAAAFGRSVDDIGMGFIEGLDPGSLGPVTTGDGAARSLVGGV